MAVAGYTSNVLVTSQPSVALTNDTLNNPSSDGVTWVESVAADRYWDSSVVPVIQAECDEIQSVVLTGAPTGGTFTLTFGGNTTAGIAWNAAASAVQTALNALASIGANGVTCSGGPLPATPVLVEFTGASLKDANQATMTFSGAGLTGGSSPNVSVTVTQNGQTWTAVTPASIRYCGGIITLSAAFLGSNIGVRAHSANYFPYATVAEANSAEFSAKVNTEDTTTFASAQANSGAKSYTPTTMEGTLKYTGFWINEARALSLVARDLLVVSFVTPTGNRYEGYVYATDCDIKDDVNKTVNQDLSFQLTHSFFAN